MFLNTEELYSLAGSAVERAKPKCLRLTKICNHSPLPTAPHIRLGLSAGINEHHVAKNLLNQSDFAQVGCHLTTNLKDPLPE